MLSQHPPPHTHTHFQCCRSTIEKTTATVKKKLRDAVTATQNTHMHSTSMRFDKECCRSNFKKKRLRHAVTAPPQTRTHTHSFNAFRKAVLSQHHWKNNSNCKKTFGGMLSQQPKTHTCTQRQCVLTKNAVAATLKKRLRHAVTAPPQTHTHKQFQCV